MMSGQKQLADGQSYDLIVIGSGIGALTAAAISAREGRHVLLLEKQATFGGYATSFNRAGMNFDVSLHQLSGMRHGRMPELFKLAGVEDEIEFLFHDDLSEIKAHGLDEILPIPNGGDPSAYIDKLIRLFPGEKRGIKRWFWYMRRIGRQVGYIDKARTKNPIVQGAVMFFAPLFAPLVIYNSTIGSRLKWALRGIKSEPLKHILLHFSGYYGLPAEDSNLLFPMAGNYGYYYNGGAYIKGGSQRLSNALAKQIIKKGGSAHRSVEIVEICLEGNRATGVKVRDKKNDRILTIHCNEILSSANPVVVSEKLLPKGKMRDKALQKLTNKVPSMSCMAVYFKLSKPVSEINPRLAKTYELFYLSPGNEKEYYDFFRKRDNFEGGYEKYTLGMTFHAAIDPDLVKRNPDKGSLNLFYPDNYDRWAKLSKEDYKKQKEIELEKILKHLGDFHPELVEHIEHVELGTPLTMERYTSNYKGAIYGFEQSVKEGGFRRPSRGPVKNLFFASAWSFPGGGYEGSLRAGDMFLHPFNLKGKFVFLLLLLISIFGPHFIINLF